MDLRREGACVVFFFRARGLSVAGLGMYFGGLLLAYHFSGTPAARDMWRDHL